MFPINSFEPERGLVVHLVVGIHVADVVVADQVHVHVTSVSHSNQRKLPSTWRNVRYLLQIYFKNLNLNRSLPSSFISV